jgi:hypothetical protein
MLSLVVGVPITPPVPVPVRTRSEAMKVDGLMASENTTVKLMATLLVGSACPAAWLMVAVGAVVSIVKLHETELADMLPAVSVCLMTNEYVPSGVIGAWVYVQLPEPLAVAVWVWLSGAGIVIVMVAPFSEVPVKVGVLADMVLLQVGDATTGTRTTLSKITVLSVLVAAVLALPAGSVTLVAVRFAMTVPLVVAVTGMFQVMLSVVVGVPTVAPVDVPVRVMSADVNEEGLMASENTTVKLMGEVLVGSACPAAWLMVAVGAVVSGMRVLRVTVLSVLVAAVLELPAGSVTLVAGRLRM